MIILIDTARAFDKIQYHFMIKILNKLGIEGTYISIRKAMYTKHTANITFNREKSKVFPLSS